MKRTPAFLLALLAIPLVFSASSQVWAEAPTILAERMVEALALNDYNWAVAHFDEAMKKAFTAESFRQAWQTVLAQKGKFKGKQFASIQKIGEYQAVFVDCRFENGEISAKVVFDKAGKIAGLFFTPSKAGTLSRPPAYAIPERFQEIPVEVGTGAWALPGLLTKPVGSGTFPAVVLVHGSGPNDRDETVGECKPFRDLAWGLSSRGIAVLRYDKRTLTHRAQIMAQPVGFTVKEETVNDAVYAVTLLTKTPGIDPARIWVLGHSLGGMLIPRIARIDPRISGFIILAGATRPLEDMMIEQMKYVISLQASPTPEMTGMVASAAMEAQRIKALKPEDRNSSYPSILGALPCYWLDLKGYEPAPAMKEIGKPTLILHGGRDYQVTEADLANWKTALSGRRDVRVVVYPQLNHLFVKGDGPSDPNEYRIPGNVAEPVIKDISEFVTNRGLSQAGDFPKN